MKTLKALKKNPKIIRFTAMCYTNEFNSFMVRIDCHPQVSAAVWRVTRISATELSGNSNY